MKTAGIFLIAAGILLAGQEWEKYKSICVRELEYFYRFLQFLEQEVVYRQAKLPLALEHFRNYAGGDSAAFALLLAEKINTEQDTVAVLWRDAVKEIYGKKGFEKEELRIMETAGNAYSLWQKERIGEQSELDRKCLWELWRRREQQFQKDRRLFRCLSAAASLFAVILLI